MKVFRVTWLDGFLSKLLRYGETTDAYRYAVLKSLLLESQIRLRESADSWGDPVRDDTGAKLRLFDKFFVTDKWVLRYALHHDQPEVFVFDLEEIE